MWGLCASLCGFALSYKFKGPFLRRFHFCTRHEIKSGRSHRTALSNISLCILNSHKCIEVVFPGMKSVAVVSLVYKVQYTNVETGTVITRQGFRTLYVHYGDFTLQRCGRWRRAVPEGGGPASPVGPSPAGTPAGGARQGAGVGPQAHGRPALAPRGSEGSLTASVGPADAEPPLGLSGRRGWKLRPPCASSTSRRRPPSPTGGEGSPWVRRSLLFAGCQAGFSITAFSVSLPVRLCLPQDLGIVEIGSMNFEFCCLGGLLGGVDSVTVESF